MSFCHSVIVPLNERILIKFPPPTFPRTPLFLKKGNWVTTTQLEFLLISCTALESFLFIIFPHPFIREPETQCLKISFYSERGSFYLWPKFLFWLLASTQNSNTSSIWLPRCQAYGESTRWLILNLSHCLLEKGNVQLASIFDTWLSRRKTAGRHQNWHKIKRNSSLMSITWYLKPQFSY